jgi:hypothetical protein
LTTLRPSLRNTIVNYNAFQKVFRARFDESKSNVTTLNFSTLAEKQPFLSDGRTPYLKFLRKNTESFYRTPFYSTKLFYNFNTSSTLANSLLTPIYDFPFLLAKTSDVIRNS